MRGQAWLRSWAAANSRKVLTDEQVDSQIQWSIGYAGETARTVLQQRSDVVVQVMDDGGLQLWVVAYRDPDTNETTDRHLTPAVAVALDLDWDPKAETIRGLEPAELVARVSESFFGDPDKLALEIR
ncbi:MAG TPA: hypothetical protein VH210_14985 [Gaiellaceae bacterium]|nr:hypothetical protein [Gaiellaceae bacterium]